MTPRIPPHYLYLIPGIFFAALGAFDIGADLFHHKLYWSSILFNALLFMPLLLRKAIVFKAFGIAGVIIFSIFRTGYSSISQQVFGWFSVRQHI